MRIGFDAKRAFLNNTGLGQYSRNLLNALFRYYPHHDYFLATTKTGVLFDTAGQENVHTLLPKGLYKSFPALWRSNAVKKDLIKAGVELYHGLSHEIPAGIQHTGVRTVVTMHDLIFERYPNQYKKIDAAVYRRKFRYACIYADKVIAISEQTKRDLVNYYNVRDSKITVCYQSCNPIFQQELDVRALAEIKERYGLPADYFLYVGSVIERKNLLNICKALQALGNRLDIPLVVIGVGKEYMESVKKYIAANKLHNKVVFLSETHLQLEKDTDLPGIYQMATALIYPSLFEGFGIPVLEALWSKTPVITSNISCMPETGGDAAYYVDPVSVEQIAEAMYRTATDNELRTRMIDTGIVHAQNFTPEECAGKVMDVYTSVL